MTGIPVPFRERFDLQLALLHGSLLLRTVGDPVLWPEARRWGGQDAAAIVLFALLTALAARGAHRPAPAPAPRPSAAERVRG